MMWQSDRRDFEYVGMRGSDRELDLDRRDVLASCLDDILEAVFEPEDAVVVEMAGITGMKPAMAEGFRGCFRVVQITRHGLGAAINDFTADTGGKQLAIPRHDGDLHVNGGRADCTGMAQLVLRPEE